MHTSPNPAKVPVLPVKSQVAVIVGIVLLLGAGALAAHFLGRAPAAPAPQPAPPGTFRPTKEQLGTLGIAPAQAMSFRGEQLTDGAIAYNDDATTPVFSPFSGQVTRIIADLGRTVKKGDPLMAVAATEFVQARSALITARAQLTLAVANEKRLHALYEAKAAALKDWQQSQSDLAAAQSNLDAAQSQLRILGKSSDEIHALETGVKAGGIHPEALVRAPVSGTITQRQVGLGQNIQSVSTGAANPVFVIGNLSTVWLVANVREDDAPLMRVGLPVEVHVLAFPGRVFKAKITWVAPAMDPNTHRLPVRARVDNRDGALKPMMFANFDIVTSGDITSVGVPQSAVVYEGSDAHVFVGNDDGTLAIRPIRVGRVSGDMIEVTSGLAAGEKIVTRGTLFIDRASEGD